MVRATGWWGRGLRLLAVMLALAPTWAAADDDLTAWQEITVLTVSKLEMAVADCGYTLDGKQLDLLLVSSGLTLDQVHAHHRSTALQHEIDAVASAFKADRQGSCTKAWNTFGPDGTARGYLDQ